MIIIKISIVASGDFSGFTLLCGPGGPVLVATPARYC